MMTEMWAWSRGALVVTMKETEAPSGSVKESEPLVTTNPAGALSRVWTSRLRLVVLVRAMVRRRGRS